ncbi:toll-like receptor 22 isoform X1 [Alosa sapidissima]|uniref:toll-like receptor 22 isoform X1 n=1 Tax=Alosa sapidissima TaxID=34773 RepID=UPI001C08857B|nr:toll-like receptor 22 isoform X1 [Alosa sapidissima]
MRRRHMAAINMLLLQLFLNCLLSMLSEQFSLRNCILYTYLNGTDHLNVSCSLMELTKVPSPIPIHSEALDISYNRISNVTVGDFRNLSNLRNINMSKNEISMIEDGAFKDLIDLERLSLDTNKLTNVTRGWLQGLFSLSVLRLDDNQIEYIEYSAFVSLLNLTSVHLRRNQLRHLEQVKSIFHLPNLLELFIGQNKFWGFVSHNLSTTPLQIQRLDLSSNPLKIFQITNNILPNLNYLNLINCGRRKSPFQWIVQNQSFLNSTETLNVGGPETSEGMIKIIQSFNSSLKTLQINPFSTQHFEQFLQKICIHVQKSLSLKHIKVPSLSDHLFKSCHQLQEIQFAHNNIANISSFAFEGLNQLQVLHVQDNLITVLNNITNVLPNLKLLDMSYNRISHLACFDFSNITRLYLYHNYIIEIKPCTFNKLTKLEVLLLASNKLLSLENIFNNNLPNLKVLDLQGNKISRLTQGVFKGLHSLKDLILTDNQIYSIATNAFTGLKSLKSLFLTLNKISKKTLEHQGLFLGMPNLEVLDLASNVISFSSKKLIYPPFTTLKSLKTLYMNSQSIQNLPSNLLQGLNLLSHIYGENLNLQRVHPDTFNHTPNLTFLDLSKNKFSNENSLSPKMFHPIPGLSELYITQNHLPSLDFLLGANLSQLTVLKASDNQLQGINQTLAKSLPQLTYLDLQKNPFVCDCSNAWFLDWAKNDNYTQVVYLNKYKCSYPSGLKGQPLEQFNVDSCNETFEFIYFLSSFSLVTLTMLVSFFYNFLRWQLVYAYYLFLAFLYDSKKRQRQHQQGFQYDAFVSYNSQDELWVLRELLPNLEADQGWRLCLHHRDFEPGKPIIDNIVDGIYSSRKTICVITRSYLRSEWCSREIQVASFRLFDEQNDVLILIFLEDIPATQLSPYHRMRKLVKKRTYLTWPKPGKDTSVFWQKLQMAMNTNKGENPILLGQEN